ncbi:hypothetical protein RJ641_033703 [Dillenia turbinata]|uniref:Uncharacterized protein n=1 Tax=Dillenia turbinata TaxID=194707 RepID=A0AAN8VYN5_9MAGN
MERITIPRKRKSVGLGVDGDDERKEVYKFKVLLPNGTRLDLSLRRGFKSEMGLREFLELVREEYERVIKVSPSPTSIKQIVWDDVVVEDTWKNEIIKRICFKDFVPKRFHILRLRERTSKAVDTFENMWDLTPDPRLFLEFPKEYTYVTALSDLIDNSLQAVWSNKTERKLISVEIRNDRISVFDSGPGMDGSDENSIAKWGTMGASLHRSSRGDAIGGKPPYLTPFFGMFGYGGPIASLFLGRSVLVSSKTKASKKVYTLHLERESLEHLSVTGHTWQARGGMRDPLEEELRKSPHHSFTKVDIFEPMKRHMEIDQLLQRLKDIYFPYIQCDEISEDSITSTPVDFQVDGKNLAGIVGGEVAITNLHSGNGPNFVLQLQFHYNPEKAKTNCPGLQALERANARLTCVYFPFREGKEDISRILESLEAERLAIDEDFENFRRVSIRRLGRLLPDARWDWLPFMDLKQKKGYSAEILKKCCRRVKCFVETDAGFSPTASKTDLARNHPFTIALKDFGKSSPEEGVNIVIFKDEKQMMLSQLGRAYQDWILAMHDKQDEEFECGEDQPVIIVNPANKKALRISANVIRVHRVIKRKGISWKSGQKMMVCKGACAGCHSNNVYATLQYILLEGLEGDSGLPEESCCILEENDCNTSLDVRKSLMLPISVIDKGKCRAIESTEWNNQLKKQHQKAPATIDILNAKDCSELEIDGALPVDASVCAGHPPPREIIAVIRPNSFNSCATSNRLDQRYIIKSNAEMFMEVKYKAENKKLPDIKNIWSVRLAPSSRKGFDGLYIFPVGGRWPKIFQKSGVYIFSFSLVGNLKSDSSVKNSEKRVQVKASPEVGKWEILNKESDFPFTVRAGACFPPLHVACYDIYDNRMPFNSLPDLMVKLDLTHGVVLHIDRKTLELSSDKLTLIVKDVLVECRELDRIRPSYKASLVISTLDELHFASVTCEVVPGPLSQVKLHPTESENGLIPGCIVKDLMLQMFDAYGNHVREGSEVHLNMDGFHIQELASSTCKVDHNGCIDLSGLLKVTATFGGSGKMFRIERRWLRAASGVPDPCAPGSKLENFIFEIVNSEGLVDYSFHDHAKSGQSHLLVIKSELMELNDGRYRFEHGRCIVPSIALPQKHGLFCFVASHSHLPELHLEVKVNILGIPKEEYDEFSQLFDRQNMPSQSTPPSKHVKELVLALRTDEKKLENDVLQIACVIGELEQQQKMLNDQRASLEQVLYALQKGQLFFGSFLKFVSIIIFSFVSLLGISGAIYAGNLVEFDQLDNLDYATEKEAIRAQIDRKSRTAAAVFCRISFWEPHNVFMQDIVGVVALLGAVCSNELSRILSAYLGEDQMLAIVCKSNSTAHALLTHGDSSGGHSRNELYVKVSEFRECVNCPFNVICLESIRPYTGEYKNGNFQHMLALPDPTLPNGQCPMGFLGHAVNMIKLDANTADTRTTSGHGLRETLFYRLFGDLQVYNSIQNMERAQAYIQHGAVSLDGAIIKGNGIISIAHWESEIQFSVVDSEWQYSQQEVETMKYIGTKKSELRYAVSEQEKVSELLVKARKKFNKKHKRLSDFMDKKSPFLRGDLIEYPALGGENLLEYKVGDISHSSVLNNEGNMYVYLCLLYVATSCVG